MESLKGSQDGIRWYSDLLQAGQSKVEYWWRARFAVLSRLVP